MNQYINKTKSGISLIICLMMLFITSCSGQKEDAASQNILEAGETQNTEEMSRDQETPNMEDASENAESVSGNKLSADSNVMPENSEEITEKVTAEVQKTLPAQKVKGIYVTGPVAGSERMNELIELMDKTELNTMVIDVKNDYGEITWKMETDSVTEMQNGVGYIRDIDALMKTLKEHNIYTIARIVCFKDPVFADNHSDSALKKPDGTPVTDAYGIAWVNPYDEEVWNYLVEIAQAASDAGFDEVQFDYVRFPIGSDADAADYKTDMTSYTKEQAISDFLSYACDKLHEKDVIVTADVFGTVIDSSTDIVRVGQNYAALGATVDALSPMVYPSHYANGVFGLEVPDAHPYDTVYKALLMSQKVLENTPADDRAIVRPWLQAFTATWVEGHISYGGTQIREQIQAVYDAGYDEWILWNASSRYSSDGLEEQE